MTNHASFTTWAMKHPDIVARVLEVARDPKFGPVYLSRTNLCDELESRGIHIHKSMVTSIIRSRPDEFVQNSGHTWRRVKA